MVVKQIEDGNTVLKIMVDFDPENPRNWDNIGTMICWHRDYDLGDRHHYFDPADFWQDLAEEILGDEAWKLGDMEENEIIQVVKDGAVILPLYLYEHGMITMRTAPFSCPWDSGQVGWIYATKKKFRKETGYSEDELFSKDKHRTPRVGEHVKVKGFENTRGFAKVISQDENGVFVDWDYNKIPDYRKPENKGFFTYNQIAEVLSNKAEQTLEDEVKVYDAYISGEVFRFVIAEKVKCKCCGHIKYTELESCGGFYGRDFKQNGLYDEIPPEYRYLLNQL